MDLSFSDFNNNSIVNNNVDRFSIIETLSDYEPNDAFWRPKFLAN